MIVRREQAADRAAARAVHAAAFREGASEPVEAGLLDALRASEAWLPALSWVAEVDGQVVGHNLCTRGSIDGTPAAGLGPLGVLPGQQGRGVGSALTHAMIGAADASGEPLIALLGDPGYYCRFGFVESTALGIAPPQEDWAGYFQVLPLTAWHESMTGTFRYAAPFDGLD